MERISYVAGTGKRRRVEVLLAGTTVSEPLPARPFVEADLWTQLPADLPRLLALLPRADLYPQEEVPFAFHPTLTRVWSWHRVGVAKG